MHNSLTKEDEKMSFF